MTEAFANVFEWIVSASLKGSLLIVLVVFVQWMAGERIPARWRYAMWLLVLIRLVLPMAPESRLSLFNFLSFASPRPEVLVAPAPEIPLRGAAIALSLPTHELSTGGTNLKNFAPVFGGIWAAGFAILLLRLAFRSVRLYRRISASSPCEASLLEESRERLGITSKLRLVETDLITTPALHGFVRPTLLVPRGIFSSFSAPELRFIFLHELAHLRRRDVIVNWAIALIQILHWFNPLVWLAAMRIREERELACDELALDCLQQDERPQYGRTILKLLEVFRTPAPAAALLGMLNDKQQMQRRLLMITQFRTHPRATMLFAALILALGTVSLTDATAGEAKRMLRVLSPEDRVIMEKLDQKVSFSLTDATLSDVLTTISAQTGVAFTQDSAVLSDAAAQQKRITLSVEQVPAHLAMIETLSALDLGFEPTENGVTVNKSPGIKRMVFFKNGEPGEAREGKFHHRVIVAAPGEEIDEELEKILEGKEQERVIVRKISPSKEEISADGVIRRNLRLKHKENGVETLGKLQLEVKPAN